MQRRQAARVRDMKREMYMSMNKKTGTISVLAALLVLFSAMIDPKVSMIVAAAALICLGVHHFVKRR